MTVTSKNAMFAGGLNASPGYIPSETSRPPEK